MGNGTWSEGKLIVAIFKKHEKLIRNEKAR